MNETRPLTAPGNLNSNSFKLTVSAILFGPHVGVKWPTLQLGPKRIEADATGNAWFLLRVTCSPTGGCYCVYIRPPPPVPHAVLRHSTTLRPRHVLSSS